MKTIAQSIAEKQLESKSLQEKLDELVTKMEAGEDVSTEIDDITIKAEKVAEDIERLKRVEKALGQRAKPLNEPEPKLAIIAGGLKQDAEEKGGALLARFAIVRNQATLFRKSIEEMGATLFKDDKALAAVIKSATGVADTTTAGWAAELVRLTTTQMLVSDLVPVSVVAALSKIAVPLDFAGSQTIKVITTSNTGVALGGAWVGEGGVIPVKQSTIGSKMLTRYKVAVITTLTRELVRSSSPAAVEKIRQMMLQDTANALDGSVLDASAEVAGIRPAGLLAGVVVTAGDATGGAASVIKDLQTMYNKMITARVGARPVLLINPVTKFSLSMVPNALGEFMFSAEVAAGNLRNFPIVASIAVPVDMAIMVDADYFAAAFDTPEIDLSEQATLTMANADATAPTQAMNNAGALGTVEQVPPDRGISVVGGVTGAAAAGFQAINLFQTWSLGQRLVMPCSFAITHAGAVQAVNTIKWGGV